MNINAASMTIFCCLLSLGIFSTRHFSTLEHRTAHQAEQKYVFSAAVIEVDAEEVQVSQFSKKGRPQRRPASIIPMR